MPGRLIATREPPDTLSRRPPNTCKLRTRTLRARSCKRERIADGDAALHQRARHDRPVTGQRKDAVDRQVGWRFRSAWRQCYERVVDQPAQLFKPSPVRLETRTDRRIGRHRTGDLLAQFFGKGRFVASTVSHFVSTMIVRRTLRY